MSRDPLAVAQHEAAHVIVGLALGLRLRRVTLKPAKVEGVDTLGHAHFDGRCGSVEAWSITYAAGSAWEKRAGDPGYAWGDEGRLRVQGVKGAAAIRALEHAAWCVLGHVQGAHTRLTRKLLDAGELSGHEVQALLGGETWNEI